LAAGARRAVPRSSRRSWLPSGPPREPRPAWRIPRLTSPDRVPAGHLLSRLTGHSNEWRPDGDRRRIPFSLTRCLVAEPVVESGRPELSAITRQEGALAQPGPEVPSVRIGDHDALIPRRAQPFSHEVL